VVLVLLVHLLTVQEEAVLVWLAMVVTLLELLVALVV
jgi:hypothetical protein